MPDALRLLFRLVFALAVLAAIPVARADSTACAGCHKAEVEDWRHSHHGWALREPTAENVLGSFDNQTVDHKGVTTRFFRKVDRFLVETDGPDGRLTTYPVKYAVGVWPLQQYLFDTGQGRLQVLDYAWDVDQKRWIHLYPDADTSPGNAFHWTGTYKNWQTRCAECHQTGFVKGYDPKARTFASRWSELTVSCASCHGDATNHLAWAKNPSGYAATGANASAKGFAFRLGPGQQASEIAVCGPCHARREQLGADSPPVGAPLADHYNLSLLRDGLYFPDGQQNDEVYVLGSFLQSKMAQKGVTCSNCHAPHTEKLVAEGNAVCTQCHNAQGNAGFPSLKHAVYDTPEHTHHPAGSAGAQCVACHMPERTYMRIDARRDHFFRMPDPAGSKIAGSPDACTLCHQDNSQEWAAEHVAQWFPDQAYAAQRSSTKLFADVFRQGVAPDTLERALALAADQAQPAIRRATALDAVRDGFPAERAQAVAPLIQDQSDLVRAAAAKLLRSSPAEERAKLLAPLLSDPVASVRIAAAMELTGVSPTLLSPEGAKAYGGAARELQASLAARADFPETQMAIAGLAMAMRNWPAAKAALAEAVALDPQLTEGWLTQARISAALGDAAGAEKALRDGVAKDPNGVQLKSELASVLLDTGRSQEAIPLLKELAAAAPTDATLNRTLALALMQTGDAAAAAPYIDAALKAAPGNLDLETLLAVNQLLRGDAVAARETVKGIRARDPLRPLPPALEQLE